METVVGIAERMQGWLRDADGNDPADVRVSLRLLRHLAGLDPLSQTLRVTLRLEMPASCPRQRSIPLTLALR